MMLDGGDAATLPSAGFRKVRHQSPAKSSHFHGHDPVGDRPAGFRALRPQAIVLVYGDRAPAWL
jgi:hypothetical protein